MGISISSPGFPLTASAEPLVLSQFLKGWHEKLINNVFGEGTPYQSHGQIRLTLEKPQMVPPGPKKTKVPVCTPSPSSDCGFLYLFTVTLL